MPGTGPGPSRGWARLQPRIGTTQLCKPLPAAGDCSHLGDWAPGGTLNKGSRRIRWKLTGLPRPGGRVRLLAEKPGLTPHLDTWEGSAGALAAGGEPCLHPTCPRVLSGGPVRITLWDRKGASVIT